MQRFTLRLPDSLALTIRGAAERHKIPVNEYMTRLLRRGRRAEREDSSIAVHKARMPPTE